MLMQKKKPWFLKVYEETKMEDCRSRIFFRVLEEKRVWKNKNEKMRVFI